MPPLRTVAGETAVSALSDRTFGVPEARPDAEFVRSGSPGGFYAASASEVDALCESKLNAFPVVAVFDRTDIEASGLLVVPTFRTPHVTIAHEDLDELVGRLVRCRHSSASTRT
jgi:hypothetical protein